MRLIVAGSRTINPPYSIIEGAVHHFDLFPTEIVSGAAKGVDVAGEIWAEKRGTPIKVFEADWKTYGGRAGPIRNAKMAVYASALLLIWDGKSIGSADMKRQMQALGKPVYEIILKQNV